MTLACPGCERSTYVNVGGHLGGPPETTRIVVTWSRGRDHLSRHSRCVLFVSMKFALHLYGEFQIYEQNASRTSIVKVTPNQSHNAWRVDLESKQLNSIQIESNQAVTKHQYDTTTGHYGPASAAWHNDIMTKWHNDIMGLEAGRIKQSRGHHKHPVSPSANILQRLGLSYMRKWSWMKYQDWLYYHIH